MDVESAGTDSRKTVVKAMQILHAFSSAEPELTLSVLCERLGMHKSVASRLVSTLCEWRMLERDPATKRIRLGMGALQLGMQVANRNALHTLALPRLGKLVDRTRHAAHVAVLDGFEMLVVAAVQSPAALRVILQLGDRRPLHATAAGKVLLANMPDSRAKAIIEQSGLQRMTPATITSVKDLEASLAVIRRTGIAWNHGESLTGAGAAAAGVFDATGEIVGAVSAVFPQNVVPATQRAALANEVLRTAGELSEALGHVAEPLRRKGIR